MAQLQLPQGTIEFQDTGGPGPVLVFVHGFLVDGSLWTPVVDRLRGEARCVVPTLPLGSHRAPIAPEADLGPTGVADIVADLLEALDLHDVTLVGNDSGGALCQLVVTRRPERVGRLVLTDCDAFDNFPPKAFRPLVALARVPGALTAAIAPLRVRALRRLPIAYGWLTKRPVPDAVTDAWVRPFLESKATRRDAARFLVALDPALMLDTAARLAAFDRPVLLAWAPEDRFFPVAHAHRLAAIFPDARVEEVPDSRTFVSWDQPDRVAELVRGFAVRAPQAVAAEA